MIPSAAFGTSTKKPTTMIAIDEQILKDALYGATAKRERATRGIARAHDEETRTYWEEQEKKHRTREAWYQGLIRLQSPSEAR